MCSGVSRIHLCICVLGIVLNIYMYLYVITDDRRETCKIGYSSDPDRRVAELNVGNPNRLLVEHRVRVPEDRVQALERKLHFELGHCRVQGEWFRVPARRAAGLLDFCVIRWLDDPLVK